jgi:protease II
VILDINEIAKGHDYCDVEGITVSPSHNILAYGMDITGQLQVDPNNPYSTLYYILHILM